MVYYVYPDVLVTGDWVQKNLKDQNLRVDEK